MREMITRYQTVMGALMCMSARRIHATGISEVFDVTMGAASRDNPMKFRGSAVSLNHRRRDFPHRGEPDRNRLSPRSGRGAR